MSTGIANHDGGGICRCIRYRMTSGTLVVH